jgi:hypothetical protein
VSLAVCVSLVALAVWSCWIEETILLPVPRSRLLVRSEVGEIGINYYWHWTSTSVIHTHGKPPELDLSNWRMIHFSFNRHSWPQAQGNPFVVSVLFPNWALAVPIGCLAWWFRRKARKLVPQTGFAVESVATAAQKP